MKKQAYKTIVDDICTQISDGSLNVGDKIGSFSESQYRYKVSRDTVVKAYLELKSKGIITTIPGKGNYVKSTNINFARRIMLLFDSLTAYKTTLYNAILDGLQSKIPTEIFFHHFNLDLFTQILAENQKTFTDFVVMPIYDPRVEEKLNDIKKIANVYLLDQGKNYFNTEFPLVCQDFQYDIYNALLNINEGLKRFDGIYMQIDKPNNPSEYFIVNKIKKGFTKYCKEYKHNCKVIAKLRDPEINYLYIIHNDLQMVEFIKQINNKKLRIGKDLAIVSYNDNPLKEVIGNGISTLSTDFLKMGKLISKMILLNQKEQIINPFLIQQRESFKI